MSLYESWVDIFPNRIPKRQYFLRLRAGEEQGLVVELISLDYEVQLKFGLVQGFNVIEEGVLLNPYTNYADSVEFLQLRSEHFPSTLYLVSNGAYAQSIMQYCGETLFSAFSLRQYNIVAENYVIMVVAQAEPEIRVKSITE